MIRRCVGMADEGDSKSLVLITRVGSTPTTGIKRKPSSLSGGLPFYLRRVRREQHCTRSQKKRPDFVGTFLFYMRYILRAPAVLFRLIPPLQGVFFAARIYPTFPETTTCFAERSYYTREKSIKTLLRPFIPPFLTDFTMFFMKKALQMNFKNILYNYKLSFFMQTFSYWFVWGRQACAFRTVSALR